MFEKLPGLWISETETALRGVQREGGKMSKTAKNILTGLAMAVGAIIFLILIQGMR